MKSIWIGNMINIGIIGNGFVGSAIAHGFSLWSISSTVGQQLRIYDANPQLSSYSFDDVATKSDIVFVCVPTPMNLQDSGAIDLTILNSVMSDLSRVCSSHTVIVIKSTVIPGTTDKYVEMYPNMNIVFNPEFLSERTAKVDFDNPSRTILGGKLQAIVPVKALYEERFPGVPLIITDAKTAEFTKYACNCFYAVKISIFNEFYQVAQKQNLDWAAILRGLISSGWVNPMHTIVPGTDGEFGFGGKCFPKDINAFIDYFVSVGVDPMVMKASWQKNLEVREKQNWLDIDGAVSNKKE